MLAGYVKTAPEWRPQILRYRFVHAASSAWPPPETWLASLEKARSAAADDFVQTMARQGWTLTGPILGTNEPIAPYVPADERAHTLAPLRRSDRWQFELAAQFIRKLMPTEILATSPKTASRKQLFGTDEVIPIGPEDRRPASQRKKAA
jgi:hypothetical protein